MANLLPNDPGTLRLCNPQTKTARPDLAGTLGRISALLSSMALAWRASLLGQ
jgi:hypothetical protein